jgi:hypothetical protein
MSTVKMILSNKSNKQALMDWEDFIEGLRNSTPIDFNETPAQKVERIKRLEAPGNELEWIAYYFPKYCFKPFASFHKKSIRRVVRAKRLRQWRKWFRGSSKSTIRMMELFYKMFAQKFRVNCLLISKSSDNAERLLAPYRANLQANQRLINDYGIQEKPGSWTANEFTTRSGHTFRAVGAEQNPRGARLDELRVTVIIFDDVDDDEVCRNPERVQERCDWMERAVFPTVDIAGDYLILMDNNLIAENSCAAWFGSLQNVETDSVNIRDTNNKSSWPEKNTEKDIDDMINGMSWEASQAEYFNNPVSQGKTFKEITWGKCPRMDYLPFIVSYGDPATSNKDKPTAKSKAHNSCKVVALLGYHDNKFYLYDCYVDNTTNSNFIDWLYAHKVLVAGKTPLYSYLENNTLQDPFYEQVLLPLIFSKGKEINDTLGITPDDRKKPEKWVRIEATLEPLIRLGQLIFNIDKKDNPHMARMASQFLTAKPTSKELGGPDAVEGAVHIIKQKTAVQAVGSIKAYGRQKNPKRY